MCIIFYVPELCIDFWEPFFSCTKLGLTKKCQLRWNMWCCCQRATLYNIWLVMGVLSRTMGINVCAPHKNLKRICEKWPKIGNLLCAWGNRNKDNGAELGETFASPVQCSPCVWMQWWLKKEGKFFEAKKERQIASHFYNSNVLITWCTYIQPWA